MFKPSMIMPNERESFAGRVSNVLRNNGKYVSDINQYSVRAALSSPIRRADNQILYDLWFNLYGAKNQCLPVKYHEKLSPDGELGADYLPGRVREMAKLLGSKLPGLDVVVSDSEDSVLFRGGTVSKKAEPKVVDIETARRYFASMKNLVL